MDYFKSYLIFAFLLIGYCSNANAQLYFPEDMVKVSGQVTDESTGENIGYVQVVNFRIHGGTMCDANGIFSIQADPSDTLIFKLLGYKDTKIPVKEVLSLSEAKVKITLTPIRFQLNEVEVTGKILKMNLNLPKGKSNPIPLELRSEDFASKPGILTAVVNPVSFLHYYLSNGEKSKRAALTAIHSERQWQILSLTYNKDVIQRITLLSGEKLDDFMAYCNAYSGLTANATTYDVEKRVKDLYAEFMKLYP